MALLLETNLGDIVIDLDTEGSPELCRNVLKLAKARYYTSTLIYCIADPTRFCQLGDPCGDGTGGTCIHGLLDSYGASQDNAEATSTPKDVKKSQRRFMKSNLGRPLTEVECQQRGRVVATEMNGISDTIGSQFLITLGEGQGMALDGYSLRSDTAAGSDAQSNQVQFRSLGTVSEDEDNVLAKIATMYCDSKGRPYADVRILRALVLDDPYDDPPGMNTLLKARGVVVSKDDESSKPAADQENDGDKTDDLDDESNLERVLASPLYDRPDEECVEERFPADQLDDLDNEDDENYAQKQRQFEEKQAEQQDKSRAIVLEMLGDLPSADIQAPENVLFVCKLNAVTEDEDLELIFSRFDDKVKVEIIRDPDTGSSLQYAFAEFASTKQAEQAYLKMNNALVDDRRIKVDFSQSVAHVWDKYNQRMKMPKDVGAGVGGGQGAAKSHQPNRNIHRRDNNGPHVSNGGRHPPANNNNNRNSNPQRHDRRDHQHHNQHHNNRSNDNNNNNNARQHHHHEQNARHHSSRPLNDHRRHDEFRPNQGNRHHNNFNNGNRNDNNRGGDGHNFRDDRNRHGDNRSRHDQHRVLDQRDRPGNDANARPDGRQRHDTMDRRSKSPERRRHSHRDEEDSTKQKEQRRRSSDRSRSHDRRRREEDSDDERRSHRKKSRKHDSRRDDSDSRRKRHRHDSEDEDRTKSKYRSDRSSKRSSKDDYSDDDKEHKKRSKKHRRRSSKERR